MPDLIRIADAARLMQCSHQAIQGRIKRGTIAATCIGSRWMIDPSTLPRKSGGRPKTVKPPPRPPGRPRKKTTP